MRCRCHALIARRRRRLRVLLEHVLGQRQDHGPGPAGCRRLERPAYVLGDAARVIDLRHPLRHLAEHPPVVDLLERLAIHESARYLADEKQQRRRVLEGGVDADRCVARSRSSRHQRDSRTAGQLAASVGHVGGATLLPADDQLDPVASVVERVQHGQVAFPGDAEDLIGALGEQALHEDLAAAARKLRWPSHRWPPFAALYNELVRDTTGANFERVSARPAGSTG